jgi:hypothetical protein
VRDGKLEKCIAYGNPLYHKSEHYCSKKCATKIGSEDSDDVPPFLSKWKLRKYKEFKDPLSVIRKKTRRNTNDLLKKGIIKKRPCVVCGKHDVGTYGTFRTFKLRDFRLNVPQTSSVVCCRWIPTGGHRKVSGRTCERSAQKKIDYGNFTLICYLLY